MADASSMPPEFVDALRAVVRLGRSMSSSMIANYTVLVFDHLLTLDVEIKRVWSTRQYGFKFFWFLLRYVPFLGYTIAMILAGHPELSTSSIGTRLALTSAVLASAGYLISHAAFIMRVYVLYGRARVVWYILLPLLLGETVLAIYIIARNVALYSEPPGPGLPHIREVPERPLDVVIFGTQALFDFVVFVMTVLKSRELHRQRDKASLPLVNQLVRDGSIYFVVMISLYMLNIFLGIFGTQNIRGVTAPIASILPLVLGQRVVLSLRDFSGSSGPTAPTPSNDGSYSDLTQPRGLDDSHELTTIGIGLKSTGYASSQDDDSPSIRYITSGDDFDQFGMRGLHGDRGTFR